MTPLQKRRLLAMLDKGHTLAVRQALGNMPHDADAQAMLADMEVSYPVSKIERAESLTRAGIFYALLAIAVVLMIILGIGLFQFIQARFSVGTL